MNSTHMITRRELLSRGLVTSLSIGGLASFLTQGWAVEAPSAGRVGFGALVPDPQGIFDLPPGFSYRVLSKAGRRMEDGFVVPGAMDGMAAFAVGDKTVLVRNHELTSGDQSVGPFRSPVPLGTKLYDDGDGTLPPAGGTTTIVIDTVTGAVEREFLSLAGTIRNCAGGPTPWGSWISCEETTDTAGQKQDHRLARDHGFAFEVPATIQIQQADPIPLTAMGRFRREAVAVHAASGTVYQTEDDPQGCFYRFLPATPGKLAAGGRLQALRMRGFTGDTTNWEQREVTVGQSFPVEWVDVPDPLRKPSQQARAAGAHRFTRGEGIWMHGDRLWFTATDGGRIRKGQIWQLERDVLTLFAEPDNPTVLENGDNLVYAPWGDLLVCEDTGSDDFPGQHLIGLTPQGVPYRFGRNRLNLSELAGACFAPDGKTLFVNIFFPGLTLAITGPWQT